MANTDKDIISVLLKSVFDKGLISEMTYRNSLNQLRTFDDSPLNPYNDLQQNNKKGVKTLPKQSLRSVVNGYSKNQG